MARRLSTGAASRNGAPPSPSSLQLEEGQESTVALLLALGEPLRRKRDMGLVAARHAELAHGRAKGPEHPDHRAYLHACEIEEEANAAAASIVEEIADIAVVTPAEISAKLAALRCLLPNLDDRHADTEIRAIAFVFAEAIEVLGSFPATMQASPA